MKTDTSNTNPTGSEAPLEVSTIFELLRSRRRRHLLYYLSGTVEPVSLDDLVADLGRLTTDPADLESIRADVHHRLLPTLTDVAVVDYDPTSGTVTLLPAVRHLEPYLGFAENDDRRELRS